MTNEEIFKVFLEEENVLDEFIHYNNSYFTPEYMITPVREVIVNAFPWSSTSQDFGYWGNLSFK